MRILNIQPLYYHKYVEHAKCNYDLIAFICHQVFLFNLGSHLSHRSEQGRVYYIFKTTVHADIWTYVTLHLINFSPKWCTELLGAIAVSSRKTESDSNP